MLWEMVGSRHVGQRVAGDEARKNGKLEADYKGHWSLDYFNGLMVIIETF